MKEEGMDGEERNDRGKELVEEERMSRGGTNGRRRKEWVNEKRTAEGENNW